MSGKRFQSLGKFPKAFSQALALKIVEKEAGGAENMVLRPHLPIRTRLPDGVDFAKSMGGHLSFLMYNVIAMCINDNGFHPDSFEDVFPTFRADHGEYTSLFGKDKDDKESGAHKELLARATACKPAHLEILRTRFLAQTLSFVVPQAQPEFTQHLNIIAAPKPASKSGAQQGGAGAVRHFCACTVGEMVAAWKKTKQLAAAPPAMVAAPISVDVGGLAHMSAVPLPLPSIGPPSSSSSMSSTSSS